MNDDLEFEKEKRVVEEFLARISHGKNPTTITISTQDFFIPSEGMSPGTSLVHSGRLGDLLLKIELESKGKIKLLNVIPKEREVIYKDLNGTRLERDYEILIDPTVVPSGGEFSLSKNGNLSGAHQGRSRTVSFDQEGIKHKIINLLLQKRSYVSTQEIVDKTGASNAKVVRTSVYLINKSVERAFPGVDLIQGKADSGYRINPDIYITR